MVSLAGQTTLVYWRPDFRADTGLLYNITHL